MSSRGEKLPERKPLATQDGVPKLNSCTSGYQLICRVARSWGQPKAELTAMLQEMSLLLVLLLTASGIAAVDKDDADTGWLDMSKF